jgi:uncharacterized protein YodC (DUF2158 family)
MVALLKIFFTRMGFLSPPSKFKAGDHVQRVEGGALMIVEWVKTSRKTRTVLSCKWFDSESKKMCTTLFSEEQVKYFDWYHPG